MTDPNRNNSPNSNPNPNPNPTNINGNHKSTNGSSQTEPASCSTSVNPAHNSGAGTGSGSNRFQLPPAWATVPEKFQSWCQRRLRRLRGEALRHTATTGPTSFAPHAGTVNYVDSSGDSATDVDGRIAPRQLPKKPRKCKVCLEKIKRLILEKVCRRKPKCKGVYFFNYSCYRIPESHLILYNILHIFYHISFMKFHKSLIYLRFQSDLQLDI